MPDLVRFTETMRGYLSPNLRATHEAAAKAGRAEGIEGTFILTVVTPDVDAMVASDNKRNHAYGCVLLPSVHPAPLTVDDGYFDLFVDADSSGRIFHMRYSLSLRAVDGTRYFLRGIKEVLRRSWFPTMPIDTTTLFTDVYRGTNDSGEHLLRGVLTMGPIGVSMQGLSFRGSGGWWGLRGIYRFMRYYMGRVATAYLSAVRPTLRSGWDGTLGV